MGLGLLCARLIVFVPYTFPSASMEPNIREGDYIVAQKWPQPVFRRGDVIVFKLPSEPQVAYVKRLIGMPGDRVQLRTGQLYINDRPVQETPLGAGSGELPGGSQTVKLERETNPEGRSYTIQVSPGFE